MIEIELLNENIFYGRKDDNKFNFHLNCDMNIKICNSVAKEISDELYSFSK